MSMSRKGGIGGSKVLCVSMSRKGGIGGSGWFTQRVKKSLPCLGSVVEWPSLALVT